MKFILTVWPKGHAFFVSLHTTPTKVWPEREPIFCLNSWAHKLIYYLNQRVFYIQDLNNEALNQSLRESIGLRSDREITVPAVCLGEVTSGITAKTVKTSKTLCTWTSVSHMSTSMCWWWRWRWLMDNVRPLTQYNGWLFFLAVGGGYAGTLHLCDTFKSLPFYPCFPSECPECVFYVLRLNWRHFCDQAKSQESICSWVEKFCLLLFAPWIWSRTKILGASLFISLHPVSRLNHLMQHKVNKWEAQFALWRWCHLIHTDQLLMRWQGCMWNLSLGTWFIGPSEVNLDKWTQARERVKLKEL